MLSKVYKSPYSQLKQQLYLTRQVHQLNKYQNITRSKFNPQFSTSFTLNNYLSNQCKQLLDSQKYNYSSNNQKGGNNNQRAPPSSSQDNSNFEGYQSEDDQQSFDSDRKFSNFILFTGALALAILFMFSNVMQLKKQKEQAQNMAQQGTVQKTTYTGKADIGGPWLLYNTKGEPVTHKDFEGKYYLIYFGFTFCPDVCPVSLMKMAKAMNKVKESKEYAYFDLEAIFVSVDPDRDSLDRIDEYCKLFDPSIIGLTHKQNNHPELKDLLKKFKIHVSKIYLTDEEEKEDLETLKQNAPQVEEKMKEWKKKEEEAGAKSQPQNLDKYTLDHSIVVYLIGPDNQFLTYLGSNLDENDMADIILDEISTDLKNKVLQKQQ